MIITGIIAVSAPALAAIAWGGALLRDYIRAVRGEHQAATRHQVRRQAS